MLLAPESWPFLVAAILILVIAAVEGFALLVGVSASHWLDGLMPDHAVGGVHGAFDSWLGWLHLGKVPALVLVVLLLGSFAVIGLALNLLSQAIAGFYVPPLLSIPVAFVASLPVVRFCGGALARILPKDESSAVSLDTLVGRVATLVSGTARQGNAAQAKVITEHGQTLYVMVEPDSADATFVTNDSVLLVRRLSATRFQAIRNPRPDLL